MRVVRPLLVAALATAAVLGTTNTSSAGLVTTTVNIAGGPAKSTEQLGAFTGTIQYQYDTSTTTAATLTMTLTNTSPVANGGYLTAFVFNNPGELLGATGNVTGITLTPPLAPADKFSLLNSTNNVNGSPYGQFDFGASTGGSFSGGGPPSRGLGVGLTGTFVFNLTGTGLDTFGALAFLNTPSSGTGNGEGYQGFVARFRGFNDGGSDKVVGVEVPASVPEPSLMAMGAAGVAGLAGLRRRFGKKATA